MRRRIAMYFSWDRRTEEAAPLGELDNRFPALFEARRTRWPQLEALGDPRRFDQGIAGYLEHVFLKNFDLFAQLAQTWTGHAVPLLQRRSAAGEVFIDARLLAGLDTLIIVSFDSQRTGQVATPGEVEALRGFLDDPAHTVIVSPHHDIGHTEGLAGPQRLARQALEHQHHGDAAIPPEQRFGGFALSLMAALGMPIRNRFGLRPALPSPAIPSPIEVVSPDRCGLLTGLSALNEHPHLPHFERLGPGRDLLEVLVQQRIDPHAPPHPFTLDGREYFDAVLQSARGVFPGYLAVTDATLWNSVSGPQDTLERLWRNVALA